MNQTVSILLSAALALGLLAGCGGGTASGPSGAGTPPAGGAPAEPDGAQTEQDGEQEEFALASFTAGTLDGGTFTQDDIQDKDVTALHFWALSCGPCIAELPALAEFDQALPDHVQLVTICLDGRGSEDTVKEVLAQAGFEGITVISGDGDLALLAGSLIYTPTTVFADSEGRLVGGAVIGGQKDLSGTYLEAVNQVLEAGGKDAISLEA